ncbi:MAG: hypothetical protein J6Y75_04185 [Spirochaetaceae bacterium]|nr:hypothetical protein [Spirochaetaceae bacterium]
MSLSTNASGIAAEFFVAAELVKRGFYVSPTLKNTKAVDILIVDEELQNPLLIQVKASQSKKEWKLTEKAESLVSPKLFYIFYLFNDGDDKSEFHIVPSKDVAAYTKYHHKKYLSQPKKNGEVHKDTSMRVFRDNENKYLNKWDLLKIVRKK